MGRAMGVVRRLGGALVLCATTAFADGPPVLPDGEGRALVEKACGQCHSLETVLRSRLTRRQWSARIDAMIPKGARVTDDEVDVIAAYLGLHFGPTSTL